MTLLHGAISNQSWALIRDGNTETQARCLAMKSAGVAGVRAPYQKVSIVEIKNSPTADIRELDFLGGLNQARQTIKD